MASQLLRVSRGFARAARQAAAPVARLSSGGAAPSDLSFLRIRSSLRGGSASAVDTPPLDTAMSARTDATSPPFSNFFNKTGIDDKDIFKAEDKDLESDEALWALYERWCKHWDEKRDHAEMLHYFPQFKETALLVDRVNKANLPYTLALNKFADGMRFELSRNCAVHGRFVDFHGDAYGTDFEP